MGTTHPAVQRIILAFPQVCNRWGMKLIIHLQIAPEYIRSAGIALFILSLSTRYGQRGSGQLHTLTALPLGIYQLVPTQ